eukprot:symbB.v1.2.033995.t1/scaffold4309.1/size41561/6
MAGADFAFTVATGGSRLGARLAGADGLSWQLQLAGTSAQVDVLGYFTRRRKLHKKLPSKKPESLHQDNRQQMPITLGVLPKTTTTTTTTRTPKLKAAKSTSQPLSKALLSPKLAPKKVKTDAPKTFVAGYNPLKPAAAGVSHTVGPAKPKANVLAAGPMQHLPNGLSFQELPAKGAVSTTGTAASIGSEVDMSFSIASGTGSKAQVIERGQVQCVLGQSELKDGWVDGNVDLEQVLGNWSKALTGMRVGQRRRVHIPSHSGFDAEVVPTQKDLIFEIKFGAFLQKQLSEGCGVLMASGQSVVAKGKGKGPSGYGEDAKTDAKDRPDEIAAQLCEAIKGGATTKAEALFSRLDVELRKEDSIRLQSRTTQEEAAAVAVGSPWERDFNHGSAACFAREALPDCGSDSSDDERTGRILGK